MNRPTISDRYYLKDEQEIFDYVSQHDGVTIFDIELCCHMEHKPVMRHLVSMKKKGMIDIIRRQEWKRYDSRTRKCH